VTARQVTVGAVSTHRRVCEWTRGFGAAHAKLATLLQSISSIFSSWQHVKSVTYYRVQVSATEIMTRVAVLAGLKYAWRMNERAIAVQTPHTKFAQNRTHWMNVQTTW